MPAISLRPASVTACDVIVTWYDVTVTWCDVTVTSSRDLGDPCVSGYPVVTGGRSPGLGDLSVNVWVKSTPIRPGQVPPCWFLES